jgi:hypothetical protein
MFMWVAAYRWCTDERVRIHMIERSATDADGRLAPMVPEMPTRDIRTDGGEVPTSDRASAVAEADAPLVPDCS